MISLFAGCGGSSLGYRWAGYDELLAIDFDKNSCETFRLNFPEVTIWQRDITQVTGKEIMDFCKIKNEELDVLDGSPPCQGFSSAGKREVTDERNDLFLHFIRLINELKPKVFLMENVSGMTKGKMKGKYIEIMKKLKSLDYNVKSAILNSRNYGVPQSRERLIFIGTRKDIGKQPSFPSSEGKPINVCDIMPDAIKMNREQFDRMWKDTNRPSYTITKRIGLKFQFKDGNIRRANVSELKLLSSFPEEFEFTGSFNEQWSRIGNAVMPRFMHHLAKHIRENLL
jgi:DNA (cytosine-5)-methyltransferase 1